MRNEEPVKAVRSRRVVWIITSIGVAAILLVGFAWVFGRFQMQSVYQVIVKDGYTGTQEQWLASLVGEEVHSDKTKSAYALACENGYDASVEVWLKTLTGVETNVTDKTPYTIACENGFEGTLAEWLTELAEKPETLGVSADAHNRTQYEVACEYGYTGTFIEWLVSVTHDRVFE